jgi:hypothetical protein
MAGVGHVLTGVGGLVSYVQPGCGGLFSHAGG